MFYCMFYFTCDRSFSDFQLELRRDSNDFGLATNLTSAACTFLSTSCYVTALNAVTLEAIELRGCPLMVSGDCQPATGVYLCSVKAVSVFFALTVRRLLLLASEFNDS